MTAFETLELPPQLTLTDEYIKETYDRSGQQEEHLHARNLLLNTTARLEQWMSATGLEKARHAAIPEQLIPLFSELSECLPKIDQLAEKKKLATTLLAQTLLDKQLFQQKDALDTLAQKLLSQRDALLRNFPALEAFPDAEPANILLQSLKFVQKWESELNKAYTQLL